MVERILRNLLGNKLGYLEILRTRQWQRHILIDHGHMTAPSGHRQRAAPLTQPTPSPWDTNLRIVASFSAS
jgi:hypothetical protein